MQLACPQGGAIHNDVFCVKSGPMHVVQRPDWTDYMTLEQVRVSLHYLPCIFPSPPCPDIQAAPLASVEAACQHKPSHGHFWL